MPFPVFNPNCVVTNYLSVENYFHPSHNVSYQNFIGEPWANTKVYLRDLQKILKMFTSSECIDDFLLYHARSVFGSTAPDIIQSLKDIYNLLPEDSKYLIAFCSYRSPSYSSRRVQFTQPQSVIDWVVEFGDNSETSIPVAVNEAGVYSVPPGGYELLSAAIPGIVNKFNDFFAEFDNHRIYDAGAFIPHIIARTLCYNRNGTAFYPLGNTFSVPYDWISPATLQRYINEGYRVTISIRDTVDRLQFKVLPAANDRRQISTVLPYSSNVLTYLPYTIKGPKEPQAPTYGVELETSSDYSPKQLIDAQRDLFFILKQDGSIYGNKSNAYELVTVPATLKAHKRLWAEFFEKIDYNLFDTSKATGNGMHVHVDRLAFSTNHLNRFTWFITNPANDVFMLAVSERPSKKNFEEWARMPVHTHHATRIRASRSASATNRGNRGAVHFKGHTTVEVRMFKGIVSYATIVKNLEFVDSVFEYTRTNMLCQMSLKHYLAWLDATPKNKYQILKTFLSEIKLQDMVISSEISDYLWTADADHVVVEKLNKAPFTVTNAHITSLNKKKRKRTYVMKDGKITCVSPTGGLLAKLDKTMQQRQTRGSATLAMNTIEG